MNEESSNTYIVPPANLLKGDRIDVLVKNEGEVDENAKDGETLGTDGVGENLESIGYNQGCEGDVVGGVEQEDEGNNGMSSGLAFGDVVTGRADSLKDEKEQHAGARGDEKDSSSYAFDKRGCGDSPCQVPDLEYTIDKELGSRVGNTNGLEDFVEVVGDEAVSRPRSEPSESDDNR